MNKRNDKGTPHPKNIAPRKKPPAVPTPDHEFAGYDAAGQPFFRLKASKIPGPRSGTSNRSRRIK